MDSNEFTVASWERDLEVYFKPDVERRLPRMQDEFTLTDFQQSISNKIGHSLSRNGARGILHKAVEDGVIAVRKGLEDGHEINFYRFRDDD